MPSNPLNAIVAENSPSPSRREHATDINPFDDIPAHQPSQGSESDANDNAPLVPVPFRPLTPIRRPAAVVQKLPAKAHQPPPPRAKRVKEQGAPKAKHAIAKHPIAKHSIVKGQGAPKAHGMPPVRKSSMRKPPSQAVAPPPSLGKQSSASSALPNAKQPLRVPPKQAQPKLTQ